LEHSWHGTPQRWSTFGTSRCSTAGALEQNPVPNTLEDSGVPFQTHCKAQETTSKGNPKARARLKIKTNTKFWGHAPQAMQKYCHMQHKVGAPFQRECTTQGLNRNGRPKLQDARSKLSSKCKSHVSTRSPQVLGAVQSQSKAPASRSNFKPKPRGSDSNLFRNLGTPFRKCSKARAQSFEKQSEWVPGAGGPSTLKRLTASLGFCAPGPRSGSKRTPRIFRTPLELCLGP